MRGQIPKSPHLQIPNQPHSSNSTSTFSPTPNAASPRSNSQYTTGTTISESNIELLRPPMMA